MDRQQTKEALRLLESHQPFVRAAVVRATGSVPGKVGASMLVRMDGSTMGTVGGAALEEEVKVLAQEMFTTTTNTTMGTHNLNSAPPQDQSTTPTIHIISSSSNCIIRDSIIHTPLNPRFLMGTDAAIHIFP